MTLLFRLFSISCSLYWCFFKLLYFQQMIMLVTIITWVYSIYWMLLESSEFLERCVILFTLTLYTNNICLKSRFCQNLVIFYILGLCSMNRLQISCQCMDLYATQDTKVICPKNPENKNDIITKFGLKFGAFKASRIFP